MARKKVLSFETSQKVFPMRLTSLMVERNINQPQLADVLGVRRQTISNYANGQSSPDWETLVKIALFFNVSADYLLGLREDPTTDRDVQFVSDYTGLAAEAVETMHRFAFMHNNFLYSHWLENFGLFITFFYESFLVEMDSLRHSAEMARIELQDSQEKSLDTELYDKQLALDDLQRALFAFSRLCEKIPRKLFDTENLLENLEHETIELEKRITLEDLRRGQENGKYQ